jgi:hypothetical protein
LSLLDRSVLISVKRRKRGGRGRESYDREIKKVIYANNTLDGSKKFIQLLPDGNSTFL